MRYLDMYPLCSGQILDDGFNSQRAVFMRKTPHLPDLGLRDEIPPSNRIHCIFISRLRDERNSTGIVKSHFTRGGFHLAEVKFFETTPVW